MLKLYSAAGGYRASKIHLSISPCHGCVQEWIKQVRWQELNRKTLLGSAMTNCSHSQKKSLKSFSCHQYREWVSWCNCVRSKLVKIAESFPHVGWGQRWRGTEHVLGVSHQGQLCKTDYCLNFLPPLEAQGELLRSVSLWKELTWVWSVYVQLLSHRNCIEHTDIHSVLQVRED